MSTPHKALSFSDFLNSLSPTFPGLMWDGKAPLTLSENVTIVLGFATVLLSTVTFGLLVGLVLAPLPAVLYQISRPVRLDIQRRVFQQGGPHCGHVI